MRLETLHADITTLAVDALVNAANETLLGGAGVDGAIHRAAGPGLLTECRRIPEVAPGVRCPTGEARITGGHRLLARHVIHTVGPVWRGGGHDEDALLARCYQACLALAEDHGLHSIAFPAISCGAYGFPPQRAVPLAVDSVRRWNARRLDRVIFCAFDAHMLRLYREALGCG
jgi:O-acetyl-ADP-ribose deacetylase (regulator of RNase III)